ncbi:hypothetical protein BAUCODRAFT_33544 [Baudoinia panamericana UAMH 10762]|uniref:Mif2/CENP-C cupin domain-containing protein n=1 Tax=Baudoinia panamericana (strain UAMH 10762) TaxID=717646 RepID=M2MHT7_BAUPA|nr:uncharacterized protein BAUCODRAFT_33544 [Baudoinia panamericana UAMH 10762]EMC96196.1 hypothetical protein BAUCODRAFT_33544 [Baudoinia panamericana UAMH 10762]
MNVDKENTVPVGMQAEGKGKTTPGRLTPGRLRRKTEAQYFDVGKVGRKTGLVLPDKGVRDEYGLEPVSGIFSSPIASPARAFSDTNASSDIPMQESSGPDVSETLHMRKTPKLPLPRAATPKHTKIGSPKRGSTGRQQPHTTGRPLQPLDENAASPVRNLSRTQPPANRMLDFAAAGAVRKSIESLSPFKPKRALRRSSAMKPDPFASPETNTAMKARSPTNASPITEQAEAIEPESESIVDEGPLMLEDDVYDPLPRSTTAEVEETLDSFVSDLPSAVQKAQNETGTFGRNAQQARSSSVAAPTPSKKRDSTVLEATEYDDHAPTVQDLEEGVPASPAPPKRRKSDPQAREHNEAIDPALLEDQSDRFAPSVEYDEPNERSQGKPKPKPKASRKTAPPSRRARATTSPAKSRKRAKSDEAASQKRGASIGPANNMSFRATTPFDDAVGTTRSGRNVIKPLQYWANETRIWKHGECEGIIRAESTESPSKKRKRGGGKKNNNRLARLEARISKLEHIEEEDEEDAERDETASLCADEWEENVGVIAGPVASWDSKRQTGDPTDPVREDLAFAAPSIITREVPNSDFKYAKIMTLPFFGAGVVELPPEGFKRAKNSRKMQMCFFVHEGKVLVEIGGGEGMEVNAFAIAKGGVWVVPRGNNYAITNESRTKSARIFFAQGCEVDGPAGVE